MSTNITEVVAGLLEQVQRFYDWIANTSDQSIAALALKAVCLCLVVVAVAIFREIYLLKKLPESKTKNIALETDSNKVSNGRSIIDEDFSFPALAYEISSTPLAFQMENKTLEESIFASETFQSAQSMPQFSEPAGYAHFMTFDDSKKQSHLVAFDQLMTDLGEQEVGRRLVIADFDKKRSELGLLDVLEDRVTLNNVICKEMWNKTDLIPHAQIINLQAFNPHKVIKFIKNLSANYKDIIIFDKKESIKNWVAFFELANVIVKPSEENTEINSKQNRDKTI